MLIESYESGEPGQRLYALEDMAGAENVQFQPFFEKNLEHPDPQIRLTAVRGLRSLNTDAARRGGAVSGAGR